MKTELDALGIGIILNEAVPVFSGVPKEFAFQNAHLSKTDQNFSFFNSYSGPIDQAGAQIDNATVKDLKTTESFDDVYTWIKEFEPLTEAVVPEAVEELEKIKEKL